MSDMVGNPEDRFTNDCDLLSLTFFVKMKQLFYYSYPDVLPR